MNVLAQFQVLSQFPAVRRFVGILCILDLRRSARAENFHDDIAPLILKFIEF